MRVTCRLKQMPLNLGFMIASWFIYPDSFTKKTSDIVRFYYRYNDGQVSWDLLVNNLEYNTDNEPINIDHLLNPSEEELFQLRCTVDYDIDTAMKLMRVIDQHTVTGPGEMGSIPSYFEVDI